MTQLNELITFVGHQYFEFSIIKELAEPSKRLAEECGNKPATEELLFDFNDDLKNEQDSSTNESRQEDPSSAGSTSLFQSRNEGTRHGENESQDLLSLANATEFLETLLGPLDQSPERAQDVLDLGMDLPDKDNKDNISSNSLINIGSFIPKSKAAY